MPAFYLYSALDHNRIGPYEDGITKVLKPVWGEYFTYIKKVKFLNKKSERIL